MFLQISLRAPSATGPKVVSPTVAPQSLGPNLERGAASTPWTRSVSRSATLRAGRHDSSWRSTVRVNLQKLYCHRGRKIFRVKPLVRAKTVCFFKIGREFLWWFEDFERTELPPGLLILDTQRGARLSFHLAAPPVLGFSRSPPPLNSGAASCVCITSRRILLYSLLASPVVKILSEVVLRRTPFAQHFKSGDLRTSCIFGYGSEEGSVKRAYDHRTRPVEDDAIPTRRPGSSWLHLRGRRSPASDGRNYRSSPRR